MDTLPVVIISFIRYLKNRATTTYGLKYLWNGGATYIINKRKHTVTYERKIRSNMVRYSTDSGMYYMTNNVKVPFLFQVF